MGPMGEPSVPPLWRSDREYALSAEVTRLREHNQRLARFLREAKDAREDEIRADDEVMIEAADVLADERAERDRLAGVIEQIRAALADLTAEAQATTDEYGKADALSDFSVIRALLPPAPTDGTTTTDDTTETT